MKIYNLMNTKYFIRMVSKKQQNQIKIINFFLNPTFTKIKINYLLLKKFKINKKRSKKNMKLRINYFII